MIKRSKQLKEIADFQAREKVKIPGLSELRICGWGFSWSSVYYEWWLILTNLAGSKIIKETNMLGMSGRDFKNWID